MELFDNIITYSATSSRGTQFASLEINYCEEQVDIVLDLLLLKIKTYVLVHLL